MTDNQAVKLILNGEINAYEEIIRWYQKKIFSVVFRYVWNKYDLFNKVEFFLLNIMNEENPDFQTLLPAVFTVGTAFLMKPETDTQGATNGSVAAFNVTRTVPAGTFTDCLQVDISRTDANGNLISGSIFYSISAGYQVESITIITIPNYNGEESFSYVVTTQLQGESENLELPEITDTQLFNPASIDGIITMPAEFYDSMNILNDNQVVGKGIFIELWKVRFLLHSQKDGFPPVRETKFVEKVSGAQFTHKIVSEYPKVNIEYGFSNIPEDGTLAVLVYFVNKPGKYGFVDVKSTFSTPAELMNISDIKTSVNEGVLSWGVYSVGKALAKEGVLHSANLSVIAVSGPVMQTMGIFGAIADLAGDVFDELTSVIPKSGLQLAGVFVNGAGSFVIQVGNIGLNFVLYGTVFDARIMTPEEYDWANEFFNNQLPDRESIILTNLIGFGERAYTIPNGLGQIYMNMGDGKGYTDPVHYQRKIDNEDGQLFIHELTHAWQIGHNNGLKMAERGVMNQFKNSLDGDVYSFECGKQWSGDGGYNFEQQGTIAERAFIYWRTDKLYESVCEVKLIEDNVRGKPFWEPPFGNSIQIENPLNALMVKQLAVSPTDRALYVLGYRKTTARITSLSNPGGDIGQEKGGGYSIYKYDANGLQQLDGQAVRIAVDKYGMPWVVNSLGGIFRWVNGSWQLLPGAASDIAAGVDGSVWVIGARDQLQIGVSAGYGIYKWNVRKFGGSGWDQIDGEAVSIAVDQSGNPWVINGFGTIFRREGDSWVTLPGAGKDIAIGGGKVVVLGVDPVNGGGFGIHLWDDYNKIFSDVKMALDAGAINISVDNLGMVWAATFDGRVNTTLQVIK